MVGSILSGLFDRVPAQCLVPAAAFTDARWRVVYSVGVALRNAGTPCCYEAVSDYIAMHDLDIEMQQAIDSTNTVSWRNWAQEVDTSIGNCESTRAPSNISSG